jgi:2-furoyl-CoA dehydrogenase 2Fe-2S iron sulfur subunit
MKTYRKDDVVRINLVLNGQQRSGTCEPRTLLSDFLRHELGATGTHVGCEHGVCGACTVNIDGVAGRSCMPKAVASTPSRDSTATQTAADEKISPTCRKPSAATMRCNAASARPGS